MLCNFLGNVLKTYQAHSQPSIAHTIIRHTFKAYERLKSKKLIEQLFQQGHTAPNLYPLRLIYLPCQDPSITHHQVLLSVPKKKFKHAADRNAIRRKMREAYRLHKHLLQPASDKSFHFLVAYIYVANHKTCNFETIQKQIIKSIHYLNQVNSRTVDGSSLLD